MDQLTSMRVFVKVVEQAGFAAAARAVGLSTAMVSKHVAALEERLGVPLLARTTRRVVPTEAGLRFHAQCLEILQAVEDAEREVGAQAQEPVGCLRVTAPVEFGNLHIAGLIPGLMRRHPGLSVSLDLSNRVVDLVEEGLDVAVRVAPAPHANLKGRHITSSRLRVLASPAYLARHGAPASPDELAHHTTLSFALGPGRSWPMERDGQGHHVMVRPRLLSTSAEALRCAACEGEGLALLPTFMVSRELASGSLLPVLPDWQHGTLKIYALYPNRRTHPARLRVFIDALVERFGPHAERDGFAPDTPD